MKKEIGKYLAALLLFGSNGILAGHIALPSGEVVFYRTLLGSLMLLALFFGTGRRFTFHRHGRDFFYMVLSGISTGASWLFLYEAYRRIGVGPASLLYYCGPVLVMLVSPWLFGERLTPVKVMGLITVFAGVLLVNGRVRGGMDTFGLFYGAMSAVLYAGMVIANKKAARITGLENSLLQITLSFLTVAVVTLLKNGGTVCFAPESLPWLLMLGLVNTGLGCFLYFSAIGRLPVQTVAVCGYLEPLSAVLMAVLLLHEAMTPLQALGAACIVGGAVFAQCGTAHHLPKRALAQAART